MFAEDVFKHVRKEWHFDRIAMMGIGELRRELSDIAHELKAAPWDLKDAALVPEAGACADCPTRSSCHPFLPGLEQETRSGKAAKAEDHCLNAVCWASKVKAMSAVAVARAKEKFGSDLKVVADCWIEDKKIAKDVDVDHPNTCRLVRCKITDEAATPVIPIVKVEDGVPVYGSVYFVKNQKKSNGTAATGSGGKKTKKEKYENLALKQLAHAVDTVRGWLEKSDFISITKTDGKTHSAPLAALAAVFGTYSTHLGACDASWTKYSALTDAVDAEEQLWHSVRKVIVSRLLRPGGLHSVGYAVIEAIRVCDLCGFSWTDVVEKSVEKIKEPKTWQSDYGERTGKDMIDLIVSMTEAFSKQYWADVKRWGDDDADDDEVDAGDDGELDDATDETMDLDDEDEIADVQEEKIRQKFSKKSE